MLSELNYCEPLTFFVEAVFSFWPNFTASVAIVTNFQAEFLLNAMGWKIPGHVENVWPLVLIIVVLCVVVSPAHFPISDSVWWTACVRHGQTIRTTRPLNWKERCCKYHSTSGTHMVVTGLSLWNTICPLSSCPVYLCVITMIMEVRKYSLLRPKS